MMRRLPAAFAAALFATSTALAPVDGSLLILGWLLAGSDYLLRD